MRWCSLALAYCFISTLLSSAAAFAPVAAPATLRTRSLPLRAVDDNEADDGVSFTPSEVARRREAKLRKTQVGASDTENVVKVQIRQHLIS
jgi:hypothetical protein